MSISKFNIHAGFTAYKCITVHKLEPLLEKSYKTEGGIFVLCVNVHQILLGGEEKQNVHANNS